MALSLGQVWANTGHSGNTAFTFGSRATTAGSLLVGCFCGPASQNPIYSDNLNGNWKLIATSPTTGGGNYNDQFFVFMVPNNVGGGVVVTVIPNPTGAKYTCYQLEILGAATVNPYDQSAVGTGNSSSLLTANTPQTAFANEFLLSFSTIDTLSTTATWTAGSGYTQVLNQINAQNNPIMYAEWQIVAATGNYSAATTNVISSQWLIGLYTFADTPVPQVGPILMGGMSL